MEASPGSIPKMRTAGPRVADPAVLAGGARRFDAAPPGSAFGILGDVGVVVDVLDVVVLLELIDELLDLAA